MNGKLNRPQTRVMLDFLGVPFPRHGRTAGESHSLLNAIKQSEPELYEAAYDIIILHKMPEGGDDKSKQYHDLGKMLSEHLGILEGAAVKRVEVTAGSEMARIASKLDEIVDFAKDEALNAIMEEAKKFRTVKVKVGNKKPKHIKATMPAEFDKIVQLAAARLNILITGPAGCGKTFLAGKVAESLELDFASQSCSEGMSESALTGWLLPVGGSNSFAYVQSEFVRMYENGGIFLFDEMDAADPNVMVFMNQALANEGFSLPQRYEKPYIKKHKDFVAIAATNTFGNGADQMYVGRNQLDAATLDRFKVGTVPMKYDSAVEEAIINDEVLKWGRSIRAKIEQHKLRRIMSTRVMKDATTMLANDWTLHDVESGYFADWSKDELAMVAQSTNKPW